MTLSCRTTKTSIDNGHGFRIVEYSSSRAHECIVELVVKLKLFAQWAAHASADTCHHLMFPKWPTSIGDRKSALAAAKVRLCPLSDVTSASTPPTFKRLSAIKFFRFWWFSRCKHYVIVTCPWSLWICALFKPFVSYITLHDADTGRFPPRQKDRRPDAINTNEARFFRYRAQRIRFPQLPITCMTLFG